MPAGLFTYEKKARLRAGLFMADDMAIHVAWFNRVHAYADLDLHVVHGSLGIGAGTKNPVYAYGHADWRMAYEFLASKETHRMPGHPKELAFVDMHSWLEDDQGRVFDVVSGQIKAISRSYSRRLVLPEWTVIERMSKDDLIDIGLHYVPAHPSAQPLLDRIVTRSMLWRHEMLKKCVETFRKKGVSEWDDANHPDFFSL